MLYYKGLTGTVLVASDFESTSEAIMINNTKRDVPQLKTR